MSELTLEIFNGPNNVGLHEAAHMLLPGRGRFGNGTELSPEGMDRVVFAGDAYDEFDNLKDGVVVCSGYKSPGDHSGDPWRPGDQGIDLRLSDLDTALPVYQGVPEAALSRHILIAQGLPPERVLSEPNSTTTPSNLARVERLGYFGLGPDGKPDERPVMIVGQAGQLERIMEQVAPKTLRRDYVGLVVPEVDGHPDHDGRIHRLASWLTLAGLGPDSPRLVEAVDFRSRAIWLGVNALKGLAGRNTGYHTGPTA